MMQAHSADSVVVMDAKEIRATLERLAGEIVARHGEGRGLALLGIQRRGVHLAARLGLLLQKRLGRDLPSGTLDINLYRDDWTTLGPSAVVGRSAVNFELSGLDIILVDDVLFTGRTIRAALEALADVGRPRRVELLVLVDRGHRELPIQADYTGRKVETARAERIDVLAREQDGEDLVVLRRG